MKKAPIRGAFFIVDRNRPRGFPSNLPRDFSTARGGRRAGYLDIFEEIGNN